MMETIIKHTLTESELSKLSQAVQLIREAIRSVDDYHPLEDERLDVVSIDDGASSLLRLVAITLQDELEMDTYMRPPSIRSS